MIIAATTTGCIQLVDVEKNGVIREFQVWNRPICGITCLDECRVIIYGYEMFDNSIFSADEFFQFPDKIYF